jgi:methylated-DNA-[protein]-cysteine S-methyltransferase
VLQRVKNGKSPQPSSKVSFRVETDIGPLGVTISGDAVTEIDLRPHGGRPPATPFERGVERELQEYGRGERKDFTFRLAPEGTAFEQEVWRALLEIPYGEVRTYGGIAKSLGNARAARAVGLANHNNPIAIVIPCHRVVGANGSLTGYGGGLDMKRRLLALEARTAPFGERT